MPETATAVSTNSQSGTQSVSTSTQQVTQNEPESAYERIVRDYFSELSGDTVTESATSSESTSSTQSSNVERAFTALSAELQAIKQQLAGHGQKPEKVTQETKDEFLDLYARGDKEGARQALIREMAPQIKADLTRSISQDVIRTQRAETEIREYGNRLRSENPELVPFERAISLEAQDMVRQAVRQEIVKTVEEYVSASKQALKLTVDAYKKRALALKGEGVTQAQTRQTQVVSSSAVSPGQTQKMSSDGQSQEPDVSAKSYLERRRELNRAGRGI